MVRSRFLKGIREYSDAPAAVAGPPKLASFRQMPFWRKWLILLGGRKGSKNYQTNPFWKSNPKKTKPLAPHRANPFCHPTGEEGIDEDDLEDELTGVGGGASRMSEVGDGFGAFAGDDEGFGVDAGFEGVEARRRLCLRGCWGQ